MGTKPEMKTVLLEGVEVTMQKCRCDKWFVKNHAKRQNCSDECAVKFNLKWQKRNSTPAQKARMASPEMKAYRKKYYKNKTKKAQA